MHFSRLKTRNFFETQGLKTLITLRFKTLGNLGVSSNRHKPYELHGVQRLDHVRESYTIPTIGVEPFNFSDH